MIERYSVELRPGETFWAARARIQNAAREHDLEVKWEGYLLADERTAMQLAMLGHALRSKTRHERDTDG